MNDAPPRLWTMRDSDDVMMRVQLSIDSNPPRLHIRSADAFIDYLENDWATTVDDPSTGRRILSPPLIELEIVEAGFATDLFIHETLFVSVRRCPSIRTTRNGVRSTRAGRRPPYRQKIPKCFTRPGLLIRSIMRGAKAYGSIRRGWRGKQAACGCRRLRRASIARHAFVGARFVAPAPLFAVDTLGTKFVTDALVERVRWAGLPGIAFKDAAHGLA